MFDGFEKVSEASKKQEQKPGGADDKMDEKEMK